MVAKKRSREADSLEGGVMEVRQKVSAKKGGDVPSKAKGKKLQAASQQTSSSTKDLLFSLPPELLNIILDFITDPIATNALCRTCKQLYTLMMPRLYKRIAVAAMFHAHIPKLIRTLEPHLTIAQKKQLRSEGQYKGQQESFPSGMDENAKPYCASYVRQLVVGVVDPGQKHRYIVVRYIEEAIKNMNNLEIIETRLYNKSIGQTLSSLKQLKGLSIISRCDETDEARIPLASIRNLKHLNLHSFNSGYKTEDRLASQSMLFNSKATLQSLALGTNLEDLPDNSENTANGSNARFTALKSLSISGLSIDQNVIKFLDKSFDFMQLNELIMGYFLDPEALLLHHLAKMASSSISKGIGIKLRSLDLSMTDGNYNYSYEAEGKDFKSKCQFLSSFDTLTELVLPDYGQYPENINISPGLSDTLLQAILKHQNLKVLRVSYRGITSNLKIPYLSAKSVHSIIGGLPCLEVLEMAPDEHEIDKNAQALVQGENLTTLTFHPYGDYTSLQPLAMESIIKSLLSSENKFTRQNKGKFTWEKFTRLKRLSLNGRMYNLASKFGKGEKGMAKPQKVEVYLGEEKREVFYRDATGKVQVHIGYDPEHEWVNKAEKEQL